MTYQDFLNAVVDDGQEEVRATYLRPDQQMKRDGALKGFDDCRGLEPDGLAALLKASLAASDEAMKSGDPQYWYWRSRTLQVEWVANVVSALLMHNGQEPIITPTARGSLKAAAVMDVHPAASDAPSL